MLQRIDDNVEIDMSYITCAEYQLFIDEKREAGENPQPDHWTSYSFPCGDAKKPIAGVRASDAEELCEWLTQWDSVPGFKYRLPTLAEAKEYQATEKQIGCWCNDGGEKAIAGIEAAQWQAWRNDLADVLARDLKPVEALIHALVDDNLRILELAHKFDSHGLSGITDALKRTGVPKIVAKLNNQLNIINTSYFRSFNPTSTLAENNVDNVSFINDINRSGDEIIIKSEVSAKEKIDEIKSEIDKETEEIKKHEIDRSINREKLKDRRSYHKKIIEDYRVKVRQLDANDKNLTSSRKNCESYLSQARNYYEALKKYHRQIQALEDTATLKIKLLETIEKQLDEARDYIEKEKYIRGLDAAYTGIIDRQRNEACDQVRKLEKYRRQIQAISDTEPSQRELNRIINIQLSEARSQVEKLNPDCKQIKDLANDLESKLNEARHQVKKLELKRDQEVSRIEKVVDYHENAIDKAEKHKKELMENSEKYENRCNAFADALRLATHRSYWLFIICLWDLLSCKDKKDDAWNFYEFLVLQHARRVGQIPAWEGIRVVRERMQE